LVEKEIREFFGNLKDPYCVSVRIQGKWVEKPWDMAWPIKDMSWLSKGRLEIIFDGTWDGWDDFKLTLDGPIGFEHCEKYLRIEADKAVYIRSSRERLEEGGVSIYFVNSAGEPMPSEWR
jgi:hypothetical protein